jgi:hypothetical protein
MGEPSFHGRRLDQIFYIEVTRIELSNGQCHAVDAAGWNYGGDPASVREPGIENGRRVGDVASKAPRDIFDGYHQGFLPEMDIRNRFDKARLFDKNVVWSVDHDFANRVVANQMFDRF